MQQDLPAVVVNMGDYPELKKGGGIKMIRLMDDHYQLVIPNYDTRTKAPIKPDVLPMNRDGANAMAASLEGEIKQHEERIAYLRKCIANIRGPLLADMDALDKAEGGQ